MAELIPTASEAEWLDARRRGITASEIPIVMGLSPWSSPYALYHQKLGILPDQLDSAVMERGRVLEPYVVEKFAAAHSEYVYDGTGRELYAHDDRPWQLATPDRLCVSYEVERDTNGTIPLDLVAVLETKTTSSMDEWGEPGTDEIPVHYRCQVLWQMDVMRVRKAHVAVLDIGRWEVREYAVEHTRSPLFTGCAATCKACDDVELMLDAARDFLDRIDRKDAPDVDWRPATAYALKQLHPSVEDTEAVVGVQTATRYRAALRNFKYWEQRKKLYEAHLRDRMGSSRRAVTTAGEVIARRDVYEVREHVRKASTTDKLVPVYPKKARNVSPDSE